MSSAKKIRAYKTLDCDTKLRVHYHFPFEITRVWFDSLSLENVRAEIGEFSKFVPGAKDHLKFSRGRILSAGGVLGENRLMVTYSKVGAHDVSAMVREIESAFSASGYSIEYVETKSEIRNPKSR
ncbi:MAG: hypothetical protein NUW37_18085 [Planctomycetes bacterium]|nr:hypothetical protein [Planctomycetota bacterium]